MAKKLKIGWQKYEDLIEKQLSSPIMHTLMGSIMGQLHDELEDEEDEEEEDDHDIKHMHQPLMFPMSQQLIEDISMLSNFDCWMGHTNFDITHKIQDKLNTIEGVELLKVCSRYRFFIGVGKMFDFSDVRKNIELELITKGDKDDNSGAED